MGRACGMYGRREMHTEFWDRNLREINILENVGVDGRAIIK
jgi:hypothetical protein